MLLRPGSGLTLEALKNECREDEDSRSVIIKTRSQKPIQAYLWKKGKKVFYTHRRTNVDIHIGKDVLKGIEFIEFLRSS